MRDNREERKQALDWLYSFLIPHKFKLCFLICLSIFATLLVLTQPYVIKLIIDNGLIAGNFSFLMTASLGLLVLGISSTFINGYNRIKYTQLSGIILFSLREDLFNHLQHLPASFFKKERTGDIISRMDRDVSEIQRFAVDTLFTAVSGILGLFGTVVMMLLLSWKLSCILLIIIPVELLYLKKMRPRVEKKNRQTRESAAEISSFFTEKVPVVKYIQTAGSEERELQKLSGLNRSFLKDLVGLQLTEFWTTSIPAILVIISRAIVFLIGGYWVIRGEFALGTLIAFSTYFGMATGPIQSLLGLYVIWQRFIVSLDRVRYLRMQPPLLKQDDSEIFLPELVGNITIENLSFAYPESDVIFEDANLSIPYGTKLVITGQSGSGKTTLLDLIQGQLTPIHGQIIIDHQNLQSLPLRQWQKKITVVPQEPVIFRDTLRNNIRYCYPEASDEEVEAAALQAGLKPLLDILPKGLDTLLSERGASVSGGERQRIALARALLQKPLILILDEPTSAIDQESAINIVQEIDRLLGKVTRIIVSHYQDRLANADMIVAIKDKQITQPIGN